MEVAVKKHTIAQAFQVVAAPTTTKTSKPSITTAKENLHTITYTREKKAITSVEQQLNKPKKTHTYLYIYKVKFGWKHRELT